jgi:superfamily II DNA or RNA helicase
MVSSSFVMPSRSSSRVYNQPALEVWFANVALDWERYFSRETLLAGRELYRNGQISGVELADKDAIVHCTFGRKDTCYAVIEWSQKGPKVRGSTNDSALGRMVAVGGLYEIEELIADEISPLAYEAPNVSTEQEVASAADILNATEADANARAPRRLTPRFEGTRDGLRLSGYWTNVDGSREVVFGAEPEIELVEDEREALVRMTGRAREAGFTYRRETGDFILKDPARIAPFFSHARKRWEDSFGYLDLDLEAEYLAEGVREVKIIGRAESVDKDTMRVDWRFRLGRRWLDPEDAERLAKAGKGTHIISGFGLVRIEAEQSAALVEWQVAQSSGEVQTWPRYMVFSLFGDRGAELDLEGELAQWRTGITPKKASQAAKDSGAGLPEFLRPYQALGVQWMANLRRQACHGLLADEMGLGKTLQVLTLLQSNGFSDKDSLIVCPASVVPVWESEVRRWYPELQTRVLRSDATFEERGLLPTLWIASYTQLRRHKHLLETVEFGYAVLDEAQQIKNPDAKVTQACFAIQAECRLALTGTPIENRLLDLWTLFRFLMPGLLGSRRRFEDALATGDASFKKAFEKRLRKQIAPFILRRKKDKVGKDLPPKVEMDLICPITKLQREVYEDLLERGRDEMGDDLETAMQSQTMSFFALLTRLRQACCDPGLIPGVGSDVLQSGKVQMLLSKLSEALEGDGSRKVVVFSQFVQLLRRIRPQIEAAYPDVQIMELTGESRDRAKPVEAFQTAKGPAVILVSLRAGGTGITLHAADYVFLLDPWWNPAVENQAVDRVHRIGQARRVFVYRMITQGTIEERIQQLKREKRALFENTLGSLGAAADLKEHFQDLKALASLLPDRKAEIPLSGIRKR